jgi:precorrin-4 methylase
LTDIAEKVRAAKITLQALIMVGQAVDPDLLKPVAAGANGASSSHLYSSTYTHLYRRGQIGAPYTDAERDAGS